MNKKDYASIILVIGMFVLAVYLYPQLPDKIAVHWNAAGQVDSYGSKTMGLLGIPVLTIVVYGFFLLIPKIDVFKENIKAFIGYYDNIKLLFVLFMLVVYLAMLLQNMGYRFNMGFVVIAALSVLIYYIGHAMPHMKRNFFMGIRTPWTLADEKVWDEVHKIGGKTFKLNALVIILAMLAEGYAIWILLASIVLNTLFLIAYSYFLYQKEGKNELIAK